MQRLDNEVGSRNVYRKNIGERTHESMSENGYVEIDPTGRYGRVSQACNLFLYLYLWIIFFCVLCVYDFVLSLVSFIFWIYKLILLLISLLVELGNF